MQKRYVLVSDPENFKLSEKFIKQFSPEDLTWLSENRACEFVSEQKIDLGDAPVDCFTFPAQVTQRRMRFMFCDMDSTILQHETFDELHGLLSEEICQKLSKITQNAMEGLINFEESLRRRVSYLKDISEEQIREVGGKMTLNKGASELVTTMKRSGAYCVLVSGGFTHVTNIVAEKLGFDEDHGNHLVTKEKHFTGDLSGKILDGDEKGLIVKRVLQRFGGHPSKTLCVGDGANDIRMMKEAGFGIAYHAKDALKKETPYHINHTDLRSVLYAQGISDSEIVTL